MAEVILRSRDNKLGLHDRLVIWGKRQGEGCGFINTCSGPNACIDYPFEKTSESGDRPTFRFAEITDLTEDFKITERYISESPSKLGPHLILIEGCGIRCSERIEHKDGGKKCERE